MTSENRADRGQVCQPHAIDRPLTHTLTRVPREANNRAPAAST